MDALATEVQRLLAALGMLDSDELRTVAKKLRMLSIFSEARAHHRDR
jgi:hypothetical protein